MCKRELLTEPKPGRTRGRPCAFRPGITAGVVSARGAHRRGTVGTNRSDAAGLDRQRGTGSSTIKVEPLPGSLSTEIEPPSESTSPLTMGSPSPVPVMKRVFSFLTR